MKPKFQLRLRGDSSVARDAVASASDAVSSVACKDRVLKVRQQTRQLHPSTKAKAEVVKQLRIGVGYTG